MSCQCHLMQLLIVRLEHSFLKSLYVYFAVAIRNTALQFSCAMLVISNYNQTFFTQRLRLFCRGLLSLSVQASFPDSPRQFASPLPVILVVDQSGPPEIQQLFLTLYPNACMFPKLYIYMILDRIVYKTEHMKNLYQWEVQQCYIYNRPSEGIKPEINIT